MVEVAHEILGADQTQCVAADTTTYPSCKFVGPFLRDFWCRAVPVGVRQDETQRRSGGMHGGEKSESHLSVIAHTLVTHPRTTPTSGCLGRGAHRTRGSAVSLDSLLHVPIARVHPSCPFACAHTACHGLPRPSVGVGEAAASTCTSPAQSAFLASAAAASAFFFSAHCASGLDEFSAFHGRS